MREKPYWRIFDVKYELPHTLFHGVGGARRLDLDKWLEARVVLCRDGKGPLYLSGFHVFRSKAELLAYSTRFDPDRRAVCRVWVDEAAGTWGKAHSRAPVILARRMLIREKDWRRRTPLGHAAATVVAIA